MTNSVDEMLNEIISFHAANERAVADRVVRRKASEKSFQKVQSFELGLPSEFYEFYKNYDGIAGGYDIAEIDRGFFLEFEWNSLEAIVGTTEVMRNRPYKPDKTGLFFCSGYSSIGASLFLRPQMFGAESCPVLISKDVWARNEFVIFDGIPQMLLSIVKAQRAGLISYDNKGILSYDHKEFWASAKQENPNSDYWPLLIGGNINWDERDPAIVEKASREGLRQKTGRRKKISSRKKLADGRTIVGFD